MYIYIYIYIYIYSCSDIASLYQEQTSLPKPCIVGKGGHTFLFLGQLPFSNIPLFLQIQDVPTFYRPIGKTKVLNHSFNQFVYKFYQQSLLILEEYLLKW